MTKNAVRKTGLAMTGLDLPAPQHAPANIETPVGEKIKDMTFKVNPDWHAVYKATATMYGMSMKELMEDSFESWLKEGGRERARVLKR